MKVFPTLQTDASWQRALQLLADGETVAAELLFDRLLRKHRDHPDVLCQLAALAHRRGDSSRAIDALTRARVGRASDSGIAVDLGIALANEGRAEEAESHLQAAVELDPTNATGWLTLGRLRELRGAPDEAQGAWTKALGIAQRAGDWLDDGTTPPDWRPLVRHAATQVRRHRRALYFGAYESLRAAHGSAGLARVDHAVRAHLRELVDRPADSMQRPRFLYFPGLPQTPFMDPLLQPWARTLAAAFEAIREDALRVMSENQRLPNFIDPPAGGVADAYVGGDGPDPSWQAYFFWRHGERVDASHERCPRTSAVLESLELCRIAGETPEILFSVLRPGTHIKPHHGVTNVRSVMHLPLVAPPDCALRLVDRGDHAWREGELLLFDDTYLHEAWNRSAQTRIVLLMDCWNPHLSAVEKQALVRLIEAIGGLHRSATAGGSTAPMGVLHD